MRKTYLYLGFSLLMMALFVPSAVLAATEDSVVINVSVAEFFDLTIDDHSLDWSVGCIDFNKWVPTIYDYQGYPLDDEYQPEYLGYGWTADQQRINYEVRSNSETGWQLWVIGTTSLFVGTNGGDNDKPVSDIVWSDGWPTGGIWHQLSATTGEAGLVREWVVEDEGDYGYPYQSYVDWRVLLHYSYDPPGDYKYQYVKFTLTGLS